MKFLKKLHQVKLARYAEINGLSLYSNINGPFQIPRNVF